LEIWRHIDFSRWRLRRLNTTSGYQLVHATAFGRSKSISKPNLVDESPQVTAEITTSILEKQTSAVLEFYFRFLSWPSRCNLHVILHQAAEFRPNWSTHCRNMTSNPFLKMAAMATQYYFRFHNCWRHMTSECQRPYQQTKFRRHISIHGWHITASVLEKQTSAIYWNSTSGFDLDHFAVICMLFCISRSNRSTHCRNMTAYPFLKMAVAAAQYYFRFHNCWRHCLQKVKVCQQIKFRRHTSIHGDITTSVFEK